MNVRRRTRMGLVSDEPALRREAPATAAPAATVADIQRGLAEAEFGLYYQPEVALDSRRIVAVEALSRWRHPTVGLMGPEVFIPATRAADALSEFDRWVVRTALGHLAEWRRAIPGLPIVLRVNAGPGAFVDEQFVPLLRATLDDSGVEPNRLCVELTEARWDGEPGRLVAGVRRVRELGVTVALDDFGAGHNGLGRLRAIPVDLIKIDRQLVAGIDTDRRGRSIVASALRLAADLGLDVTAEGVEREAEAQALARLGCRAAQGHLFGRPVSDEETAAWLRAHFCEQERSRDTV